MHIPGQKPLHKKEVVDYFSKYGKGLKSAGISAKLRWTLTFHCASDAGMAFEDGALRGGRSHHYIKDVHVVMTPELKMTKLKEPKKEVKTNQHYNRLL